MDRLGLFLYFVLTVGGSVVYRLVFVKNTESGRETRKKEVCIITIFILNMDHWWIRSDEDKHFMMI